MMKSMQGMMAMSAAEKTDHFNVRGHSNPAAAASDREKGLKMHANKCCPCPLPGGFACRQCLSCQLILSRTCQEDGLKDDWIEYFEDNEEICIRAIDAAFIYDFAVPVLLPGQPGAIYTPGISQVAIYRPAPTPSFGLESFATVSIVTLLSPTFTDFPTPASLAPGEFAVYFPFGTPVVPTTAWGKMFAISNVRQANVAVYSTSYAALADVPYYLINSLFGAFGTDTATTATLFDMSIKMYGEGWLLQTDTVMNSTTLALANAFANMLRIVNITTPLGFWELEVTGASSVRCVSRKYVRAVYTCKKRCHACNDNPSRGCNGSRCRTVCKRVMFSRDAPIRDAEDQESFYRPISDLTMLERVIGGEENTFSGYTIHPKTFRVISSAMGDNLAFCPKWVLRKALKIAKKRENEIKLIPSAESEATNTQMARYMNLIAGQQQNALNESLARVRATLGPSAMQKSKIGMLKQKPMPRTGVASLVQPKSSIWDGNVFTK